MACENTLKQGQSIDERISDIKKAIAALDQAIRMRSIQPIIGPNGALTFKGWTSAARDGITDACAYRRIMATGSATAKAEIARAETLAGRTVNRATLASGLHSHDGGKSWGRH